MCTTAVHSSVSFTLVLRLWLRSLPKAAFRLIPVLPRQQPLGLSPRETIASERARRRKARVGLIRRVSRAQKQTEATAL
jgi:hypothetical protein